MIGKMLTKRRFIEIDAAGAGICVVATLLLYFAGVQPAIRQKQILDLQAAKLDLNAAKAVRLNNYADRLTDRLEQAHRLLEANPLQLLPSSRVNSQIAQLTQLAIDNKLELDEIQLGQIYVQPLYDSIPLDLHGRGRFPDCALFLHKINGAFPDISVESFDLSANTQSLPHPGDFHIRLIWHASGNRVAVR